MISTETTRWILAKLEADRTAEAAALAGLEAQFRLEDARQSYTSDELLELVTLAEASGDHNAAQDWAWDIVQRDSRYVRVIGWCTFPVRLRPADVPAEVYTLTHCRCDGGVCAYCTCCELWNGEHSCMWGSR